MKNKLAYLGFLGLLGFGGFFGTPLMFAFFSNLVFFKYIKVVPDELFWANIRISATRAFFVFIILAKCIIITTLVFRTSNNLYNYGFATSGFSLATAISDFVFIGNIALIEERDKKIKEDEDID